MAVVRIEDWRGLATAVSPYVLPPGATVRQVNLQMKRPGELRQRPGMEVVYASADYSQVTGMYRASNGINGSDDLIVCTRTSDTQTTIRYQTPPSAGTATWDTSVSAAVTTTSLVSPTFAEDRHGQIYVFHGNGVAPLAISRKTKLATTMGLAAPTVAPAVTPSGNGYFIERVDVLDGGGSYWAAPSIIVSGGGSRVRDARLKAIVQGGAVVAVDVIDGGSGYQTAPTLTVDESAVKGVGFRGFGLIGVDPGLQGFEPVASTTGTTSINSGTVTGVANISIVRVGARVTGSAGIPANATVQKVTPANNTFTILPAASGNATGATLTFHEPTRTGGTTASLSHAYVVDPSATTIAYSFTSSATPADGSNVLTAVASAGRITVGARVTGTPIPANTTVTAVNAVDGTVTLSAAATSSTTSTLTFTQGAAATYDSVSAQYSALIPLTPGTNATTSVTSAGTGASARVVFAALVASLSNNVSAGGAQDSSWPVRPSGAWFGASASTLLSPNQPSNSEYYAPNYYINTDDNQMLTNTVYWYYDFYKWWNNNWDFFAAFTPNFKLNFHSRVTVNVGADGTANGTPFPSQSRYSDGYVYDFSQISLRYYTGSRAELETSTDTEDKWVWTTVPVKTNGTVPYIDVELRPAKKTGSTSYSQYPGYAPPVVRVWLTYCPSSWISGVNDNQINVGWRRTVGSSRPGDNPTTTANRTATDTALGWWTAGAAETGVSSRPIVDFRQGPLESDAAGLAAGTVALLNGGSSMEQGTFFALQFDQVNASHVWEGPNWRNISGYPSLWTDGSILRPSPGNLASYGLTWADTDKAPASPAYSDEYNQTWNTARKTKNFSKYRRRLYFWANAVQAGQQGPPGAVVGTPSVAVPGDNFLNQDRASFTLRQRSDLTSTATMSESYTYTFTACQITPASSTSSITQVSISSGGTNYYGTPQLNYSGNGYGLELDAVVANGQITQVNVTNGGSGFTSPPLITADSEKAKLIPVMRPAMRGTYRCAYRYADWSQTEIAQRSITTVSGQNTVTISSAAGVEPNMVLESDNTPFMARVVSISGTTLTLSAAATATGAVAAIVRDMSRPIAYSDFSPITDIDTTQFSAVPRPTAMVWSLPSVTPPSRATVVEFFRTSGDQSLVFYRLEQYGKATGNSVSIVGTDTMTDEDLFNPDRPFYAAVPVVLPNGGLNAYRFGVPRGDMAVCAAYGDRLWYGVSTSGQNANSVFFSEYDEFESCPAENELAIQNNQKSTDSLTGLVPFATFLLCMQNSHCYALSYNTDPSVDASIQMLAHRGMLSQPCHDLFDDRIFVMDERGIYVMDRSGAVQSLSDPIRNYFDNGLLDLSHRKRFFLKVDQRNSILRAFVVTKGSNATSPNMAFCYHLNLKCWWTESWPNGYTCAVDFRKSLTEQDQPVYGAVDGDVYREGGLRDYTYRAIRSVTVTNGGSGYKTAPKVTVASGQSGCGAAFTAIVVSGVVSEILIDDYGFGYGTLSSGALNTAVALTIEPPASGTTATATATCDPLLEANNSFPQATVAYAVRTGAMELTNDGNANTKDSMQDRSVSVIYRPTETNMDLYLREFFNNSEQPRINVMPRDRGTGWVHDTTGAKTRLNMASSRSALGQATGVAKAQFAGRNYSDMGGADRHVAVELSGPAMPADQSPSEVLLYGLEVAGVASNGG